MLFKNKLPHPEKLKQTLLVCVHMVVLARALSMRGPGLLIVRDTRPGSLSFANFHTNWGNCPLRDAQRLGYIQVSCTKCPALEKQELPFFGWCVLKSLKDLTPPKVLSRKRRLSPNLKPCNQRKKVVKMFGLEVVLHSGAFIVSEQHGFRNRRPANCSFKLLSTRYNSFSAASSPWNTFTPSFDSLLTRSSWFVWAWDGAGGPRAHKPGFPSGPPPGDRSFLNTLGASGAFLFPSSSAPVHGLQALGVPDHSFSPCRGITYGVKPTKLPIRFGKDFSDRFL